jgi:hypothetical protein
MLDKPHRVQLTSSYLINVPIVGRRVNSLTLVAFQKLLHVPRTHGASNNFSHSGEENINLDKYSFYIRISIRKNSYRFSESLVLRALGHVERFDFSREAAQHDGLVDGVCHFTLGHLRNVLAKLVEAAVVFSNVVCFQVLDGLGVVHAAEGLLGNLEFRVQLLDHVSERRIQDSLDNVAHQIFEAVEQLVKSDEWTLSFNVSVPIEEIPLDEISQTL